MEITFRIATVSELGTLVELMREYYDYDQLTFDESNAQKALSQLLINDSLGRVWLIDFEEETVGYVVLTFGYSLEYHGCDAIVDELYVRQNYRRRGVGTRTLQFLADFCASVGIKAIHLVVERKNTNAQSLYRKMGFREHDRDLMTQWISDSSVIEP